MGQTKLIPQLFELSYLDTTPARIISSSLYCLGFLVRGNTFNQEIMSKFTYKPSLSSYPISGIILTINLVLFNENFSIRSSALFLFQSFLLNNSDSQLAIVSTIIPPPSENPQDNESSPNSAGNLICESLFATQSSIKDPLKPWLATSLFSCLIHSNSQSQALCTKLRYPVDEENNLFSTILYKIVQDSKDKTKIQYIVGLLTLVTLWANNSESVINLILKEGYFVQYVYIFFYKIVNRANSAVYSSYRRYTGNICFPNWTLLHV